MALGEREQEVLQTLYYYACDCHVRVLARGLRARTELPLFYFSSFPPGSRRRSVTGVTLSGIPPAVVTLDPVTVVHDVPTRPLLRALSGEGREHPGRSMPSLVLAAACWLCLPPVGGRRRSLHDYLHHGPHCHTYLPDALTPPWQKPGIRQVLEGRQLCTVGYVTFSRRNSSISP